MRSARRGWRPGPRGPAPIGAWSSASSERRRSVTSCTAPMYSSPPSWSRDRVGHDVQVLDRAGRASAAGTRTRNRCPRHRARSTTSANSGRSSGWTPSLDPLERHRRGRVDLENAIDLVRPGDLVGRTRHEKLPVRLRRWASARNASLAPQLLFGPFPVVDVRYWSRTT